MKCSLRKSISHEQRQVCCVLSRFADRLTVVPMSIFNQSSTKTVPVDSISHSRSTVNTTLSLILLVAIHFNPFSSTLLYVFLYILLIPLSLYVLGTFKRFAIFNQWLCGVHHKLPRAGQRSICIHQFFVYGFSWCVRCEVNSLCRHYFKYWLFFSTRSWTHLFLRYYLHVIRFSTRTDLLPKEHLD